MDVLCIGLMVFDIIIKPVDKNVFNVDSTRLEILKMASGGDSLNAAINMAKLGIKAGLVGKVGKDVFGEYLINEARKFDVITDGIIFSDEHSTSTGIVMVEKSGERHIAYYGKANDSLCMKDIDSALLNETNIVHVGSAMALSSLDGSGIAELFKKAKSVGKITSMDVTWDSSGTWLKKIEDALYYTDIFMPSYEEAKKITKLEKPEEMREFFRKYGLKVLAVKLGSEGCYISDFSNEYHIKTFNNVKVYDTSGAGDAFVSGFLTGITKGFSLYDCGVLGNAVASQCVMELGATSWKKSFSEIEIFIKNNKSNLTF